MALAYDIFVVEDEPLLNEAYRTILKKEGHRVRSALDGQEALDITGAGYEPDLILLDLRMPRVSGIEFLRMYDLKHKHPSVKVIVFTNLDAQKEIDEAFELGAHKYMLKAWASPKELTKLVCEVLEQN